MAGTRPTRRGVLLGAAAGLLSGCAPGRREQADPLAVDPRAALEVVISSGRFGEGPARAHERAYRSRYPRADVRHSAAQDIDKALRRRFVAGSPPDVVHSAGERGLDLTALAARGAIADLGPLLDAPSLDVPGRTVRQTLRPGVVEAGSYGGRPLVLNYAYTVYGVWYSAQLFAERGWAYPPSWDGHVGLCRAVKAAGLLPWTYPPEQPYAMSWPLIAMAVKLGGPRVALAIDNLEPGAWRSAAMTAAAEAWYGLVRQGAVRPGGPGEWAAGRAAFLSSGTWLEHALRDAVPPGFGMTVAPTPRLGTGDALPYQAVRVGPDEAYLVPAQARNLAGGLAYLRVMLSRPGSADFTGAVSSLTAVDVDGGDLRPGLASTVGVLAGAGPATFTWLYPRLYPALERSVVGPACARFFGGEIGPVQFLALCQKGADAIARDPGIVKVPRPG